MIKKLQEYDQIFAQNSFEGDLNSDHVFEFINRNSYTILTAPHAVRSFVTKELKGSDLFTGAITKLLGEQNNLSTIIRKKYVDKKETLTDFVSSNNLQNHYFIDIHGMKQDVDFELAIGTGTIPTIEYKTQIDIIKNLTEKYNIKWILNHPNYHASRGFTAKHQEKYNSTNVIQLEWRKDMRDFYNNPQNVLEKTMPFIKDLATSLMP